MLVSGPRSLLSLALARSFLGTLLLGWGAHKYVSTFSSLSPDRSSHTGECPNIDIDLGLYIATLYVSVLMYVES